MFGSRVDCVQLICQDALDKLGKGIEWIKNAYPMPTYEEREDAIEVTEVRLQIAVHLELLLPDSGHEMVSNISLIVGFIKEKHYKHVYDRVIQTVGRPILKKLVFLLENNLNEQVAYKRALPGTMFRLIFA